MMNNDAPTAVAITHDDELSAVTVGLWVRSSSQSMCVEGFWQLHLLASSDRSCGGGNENSKVATVEPHVQWGSLGGEDIAVSR